MNEAGQQPLGPFSLCIARPAWIGGLPEQANHSDVVWKHLGPQGVPISALCSGFIIFEFDKSVEYAGGATPAYQLPESRAIPDNVMKAENERRDLSYRRFVYMNAYLMALYSSLSTVQKRGMPVQEPVDPTNYYGARWTGEGWNIYMNAGRKVSPPKNRAEIIELDTLESALDVLQKFDAKIGSPSRNILSLIYTACAQYSRHQFSSAHLIAWATIEALLNIMWVALQTQIDTAEGGHTIINKDRAKILNGRDFSASIICQILSISNKIDDRTLARLDKARRTRNAFAHDLLPISGDDAAKAIGLATDMISEIANVRVVSQLSVSFWI
ncbi:MAG TPA: hypothetical protein VMF53_14130 [Alphaproteobacteria bacterium]|nr:hypothetical protein [Alphaproteobacteria bacterium]